MVNKSDIDNDEMRYEYPAELFKSGIRGKYYGQMKQGTNVVKLDSDVYAVFNTEEKVNEALRGLINTQNSEAKAV